MKIIFNNAYKFITIFIFFASCKKDGISISTHPYLVSSVQQTSFGRDSMVYIYNGNHIERMDYYFGTTKGGFYTYAYNVDSTIFKLTWTNLPNNKVYTYEFEHVGNKLMQVNYIYHSPALNIVIYTANFAYSGDKLSKVYYTEDIVGIGNMDTTGTYTPTYTGNDITKIVASDLSSGVGSVFNATQNYSYDNALNSFAAINKNYWQLGYNYKNTEVFDIFDIMSSLSAHNIISTQIGATVINYSYTKNDKGNVIASSGGGKFYLEYR